MAYHGNSSEAYLEWNFRLVSSIFWVPLTVIGISGNLMVILVVMTVRGMKTPTNCYLVSLAVADCLFFVSSTPVELSSIHLPEDVFLFGRVGCSILRFLPFLSMNASSLSITAFTVERYIGICHPMKARYICTVTRAQLIIVIIWTCSILYNSTWLFLTDLKPLNYTDWPNAYQCTFSNDRASYKAVFLFDLFAFYWIPLLLYLILYGSMARILVKAGFFDTPSGSSSLTPSAKPSVIASDYASIQGNFSVSPHRGPKLAPALKQGRTVSMQKSQSSFSANANANVSTTTTAKINLRTGAKTSAVSFGGRQTIPHEGSPARKMTVPARNDALPSSILGPRFNSNLPREGSSNSILSNDNEGGTIAASRSTFQLRPKSSPCRESKAYYGESLNKARVQVVKMLFVIVFVFALFWLPYRGLVVYNSFTKKPWIEKWYLLFAKTMVMANGAINPILYNLMSGKFRCAFILMFKRCFRPGSYGQSFRYNSEIPSMAVPNSVVVGTINLQQFCNAKKSSIASSAQRHKKYSTVITVPDGARIERQSPNAEVVSKKLSRRGSFSYLPALLSQNGAGDDEEIVDNDFTPRSNEQSKRQLLIQED